MNYVGIDFSMSSPAMTIHYGNRWHIKNCQFFYISNRKKSILFNSQFQGKDYPIWKTDLERYDQISQFFAYHISQLDNPQVCIEGYSYSSTGSVFQIGEITGILKFKLHKLGVDFQVVPPKTIKKFATDNGNANKELMYDRFYDITNIDLQKIMNIAKDKNPVSDIVDSFFICKYSFDLAFNKN